ncbi:RNA-directed DNA polymerase, eukaryota [Tanacetum coccineum]|uniref:RNA-directed DNA polymerase, eukaryota n=1 Tax=Tanacetum coccineum TaxID=301880 RepID=A0ABQ5ERL6_9ASTR
MNNKNISVFLICALGEHDKEGTRADVSASHWSANDWLAPEETKILPADQSGADTSALVSSYHWVWRFITQKKTLWARVIKAIHGGDGKIGKTVNHSFPSIWLNIIQEVDVLKSQGIDIASFIKPKCGDGKNTSFWNVAWRGDVMFKDLVPRLYMLESMKDIQVATKLSHEDLEWSFRRKPRGGVEQVQMSLLKEKIEGCTLSDLKDSWTWSLEGSGEFSVSSIRKVIDVVFLPCGSVKTRWVKEVPIKINIHAWKVINDYLPTRFNLSRRGMDIGTIVCPMCNCMVESSRHLFFSCELSKQIMCKISRWWDLVYREINSYEEWVDWMLSIRFPSKLKKVFEGANAFNTFISMANLEEIPLRGCSFTWCHRSASKMSKLDRFLMSESLLRECPNFSAITLDRYLSDHRPILLRESAHDYGPIPFRFFHYWLEVQGFENFDNEVWHEAPMVMSNAMINLMNKLKYLKKKIRFWNGMRQCSKNRKNVLKQELTDLEMAIDKGDVSADFMYKRMKVVKSIQEMDKLNAMEATQKANIKWTIEGDGNLKYYHEILNKKRNQLAICGVLMEGNWVESLSVVKNEFLSHFKKRFEKLQKVRPILNMVFPHQLNSAQKLDLEAEVSKEEIKKAVWDCGIDKSPGAKGFTFGFYRRFWDLIEQDVVSAMKYFFQAGQIPKGVNLSFIALIPKIPDAKMVKDFRLISLIGSLYKIIAKILANRLVTVLGDIVNDVQSTFIKDRQILDGPFILNEIF